MKAAGRYSGGTNLSRRTVLLCFNNGVPFGASSLLLHMSHPEAGNDQQVFDYVDRPILTMGRHLFKEPDI